MEKTSSEGVLVIFLTQKLSDDDHFSPTNVVAFPDFFNISKISSDETVVVTKTFLPGKSMLKSDTLSEWTKGEHKMIE